MTKTKATFFIVGQNVNNSTEICKELIIDFFSSPEQRSWRAIVLPSVLVSTQMFKFSLKFLRPHYFPTLSLI